jgi:hypothetical protein
VVNDVTRVEYTRGYINGIVEISGKEGRFARESALAVNFLLSLDIHNLDVPPKEIFLFMISHNSEWLIVSYYQLAPPLGRRRPHA